MSVDRNLEQRWEERWGDAHGGGKLTALGRLMFRAKRRAILAVLEELRPATICEVGCGLGYTMSYIREAGFPCTGIDASAAAVRFCRDRGLDVRHLRLEEMEERYDLISSDGMLEHFLNFEPFARHLMRVSRRYVMLIQPNHGSFCGMTLVYLANLLRGGVNMYEYNYRIEDFIRVFAEHGFVNIRNVPVFLDVFRLLVFERQEEL